MELTEDWVKRRDAEDQKAAVDEPGEHFLSIPHCPHCGQPDQDWWDGLEPNKNDGDSWESTCGDCEQKYEVTMCVETSFRTDKVKP